jgi:hypothetical protein
VRVAVAGNQLMVAVADGVGCSSVAVAVGVGGEPAQADIIIAIISQERISFEYCMKNP